MHKSNSNKRGFTLIEVLLFLAISSILVVIVLVTMGPRIRNVRFSSGINDIAENISSEFTSSNLGRAQTESLNCTIGADGTLNFDQNESPDRGTQGDCIIIGKIVGVRETKVDYYDVIARRRPISGLDCSGLAGVIRCYKPRVARAIPYSVGTEEDPQVANVALSDREYEYKNGIKNNRWQSLVFGSIQNPSGTERYQFFYRGPYADLQLVYSSPGVVSEEASSVIPYDYVSAGGENRNGRSCFELSGRKAALVFSVQRVEPEIVFGEETGC